MKRRVVIIMTLWLSMYSVGNAEKSNSLVYLNAHSIDQTQQAIDFVQANGGNIRHVFPPDILIGYVPLGLEHKLFDHSLISQVFMGQIYGSSE
jgi:hypothetical protein